MSSLRSIFVLLTVLLLLAGCAGLTPSDEMLVDDFRSPILDDAEAALSHDDLSSALTLLRMTARTAPEPNATQLEMEAAVLALALGDDAAARSLLQRNPNPSAQPIVALRDLLQIQQNAGTPSNTRAARLEALAGYLSPRIEPWRLRWLSEEYQALDRPLDAFATAMQASRLPLPLSMRLKNEAILWSALMQTPIARLEEALDASISTDAQSWLNLALGTKARLFEPMALRRFLYLWRIDRNKTIPSRLLLERIAAVQRADLSPPSQVAVLLPLSGQLQAAGEAIRRGMIAAYHASADQRRRPTLRFFDVGEDGIDAPSAYRRAVAEGAALVIGPLAKPAVDQLLASNPTRVPVLALNRSDRAASLSNFYQFGLAPEDDAQAIAALAAELGHEQLLTFSTDDEWGHRVTQAFTQAFEESGGKVLDAGAAPADQDDLAEPIQALLDLDRSTARYARLREITGARFEFEPRRRQDIDAVFIAAFETQARLIVPQLRFHRGFDLPVLGIAQSYPDVEREVANDDLAGMQITRMPWLLEQPGDRLDHLDQLARQARMQLVSATSDRHDGPLVALGIDAYRLLHGFRILALDPALEMPGATGRLRIDGSGRIHRGLPFVEITSQGLRELDSVSP